MKKHILITDSLFIYDKHIAKLRSAGFEVERLDKPAATEEELCSAIKGKHGYILGGVERVTAAVLKAADLLEVISFTGSGYTEFIPGHEEATKRGIKITTAAGANALDVAEFTMALIFEMVRDLPLLQTPTAQGGKGFYISRRIKGLTIGILGFGRVGKEVASLAHSLGMNVLYTTRTVRTNRLRFAKRVSLEKLLAQSDVLTIHVDKKNGNRIIREEHLDKMRKGGILVNAAFPHAVDLLALKKALSEGKIRAAFDAAPDIDFPSFDRGVFLQSNGQTAFNTAEANMETSDRVTQSIINVLKKGTDKDVVNLRS